MKRVILVTLLAMAATALLAAPGFFTSPTQTKWSIISGSRAVASATLYSDGARVRLEWSPSAGAPVVFIGAEQKLWLHAVGGDVEMSGAKGGDEHVLGPAFMLPFTTGEADHVELSAGKVATYTYRSGATATARYSYDSKGPTTVTITTGGKTFVATRTSIGKMATKDASLYAIHPKKAAAGQISRLAGDLFGSSDTSVSRTAGPRGYDPKMSFKDGGDYSAVKALVARDEARKQKLPKALEEFQKDGKVGQMREN